MSWSVFSQDALSETVSGVLSGALLALAIFLFNWGRNKNLESKLRKGFGRCGVGIGDGTLSLIIENRLPVEVRVRAVVLVGEKGQGYLGLEYVHPISEAALLNALGQSSSPNRIFAGAHFPSEPTSEAGVSLAGFSGGLWTARRIEIQNKSWEIQNGWIALEYPTIFGGSAFLRVHLDPTTLELVRTNIKDVRGQ